MAKKSATPTAPVRDLAAEDKEQAAQQALSRLQTAAAQEVRLQRLARKNTEVAVLIAERDALLVENAALKAALPPVAQS